MNNQETQKAQKQRKLKMIRPNSKIIYDGIGYFYIDQNNNRWNAFEYTREEAEQASQTLVGCTNCTNSFFCIRCTDCVRCVNCINCKTCYDASRKQNKTGYDKDTKKHIWFVAILSFFLIVCLGFGICYVYSNPNNSEKAVSDSSATVSSVSSDDTSSLTEDNSSTKGEEIAITSESLAELLEFVFVFYAIIVVSISIYEIINYLKTSQQRLM